MRKEVNRLITVTNWMVVPNTPNPATPSKRAARMLCTMLKAADSVLEPNR